MSTYDTKKEMERYNMAIEKPMIPFTIDRGIKSRAKKVNRAFPLMEQEDLIQDGYLFVLQILRKKPDAPPAYLMSALKRYYSHVKKKAYIEAVTRVELTDEIAERYAAKPEHPDHNIDREKALIRMQTKSDEGSATAYALMVLSNEYGLNKTEIKELLGKETNDALRKAEE